MRERELVGGREDHRIKFNNLIKQFGFVYNFYVWISNFRTIQMLNIKLLVQSEKIKSDASDAFEHSLQSFEFEHKTADIIWNFLKFQLIYRKSIHFISDTPHITNHAMYSKYKNHMTYIMLDGVRSNRDINVKQYLYCWKNLDSLA